MGKRAARVPRSANRWEEKIVALGYYRCAFCGRGSFPLEVRPQNDRRRLEWSVVRPCPSCCHLGTMEEMGEPSAFSVPADEVRRFVKKWNEVVRAEFGSLIQRWSADA